MSHSTSVPHVWIIRVLTPHEVSTLVERYDEPLAAMIDMAPTYPMSEEQIRTSLFHMFVEYTDFSRDILFSTNPPQSVLADVPPRTAAAVALEILATTRAAMPEGQFTRLVVDGLRDLSMYLSSSRD